MNSNSALEKELERNTVNIRSLMKNTSDLNIKYAKAGGVDIAIIACEGQVDINKVANLIYRPINSIGNEEKLGSSRVAELIRCELLLAVDQKQLETYDDVLVMLMNGFCIILIDGEGTAISVGAQGFMMRSVSEPLTHHNVRGSHEGFVEPVRINMSLVRRRIKSPELVFSFMSVGKASGTDICLCYIENRADKKLVEDIKRRIGKIPLSFITDSSYIQSYLEKKNILFSEIGATERPDVFAAKLYEGRIGILVDGTPFALVIPKLFSENFSTLDDYTDKPVYSTFIRILRYFSYFLSILLPGFYVAIANFNPELIPDKLLLNIASSIALTPYHLLTECIVITVFYEIMREAGLRMPVNVGHAVSIVGGIVIGDIVVSAGLVGAPMLLVVAVSSIASFIVPDLYSSIIVMRFTFILAGGIFGLFGLAVTGMLFCIKLCSMDSYGIPHTAPISPFSLSGMRDTFVRISRRFPGRNDSTINTLNGVDIRQERI